jgi:lipid II:glycine glycyltransferase (peptidoglycan interpeptide bridge formation enzyme)
MIMNDPKAWDEMVAAKTGWCHFLQSAEWAAAQAHTAWQPILTEVNGYPAAVYSRKVSGLGQVYMATKLAKLEAGQVVGFTEGLKQLAETGVVIKIDIDQPFDEALHQSLIQQGWHRSPSIQYKETVIVDLGQGREELIKSFKKRARWELNAGQRRGVIAEKVPVTPENMKIVYGLLKETYQRANFFTRSQEFTEAYWRAFEKTGQGSMYIARLEGKPLAAAFVINIGNRAFYKDGASVRIKPDVFASRVMQWQIMQDLMEQGIQQYDLCGTSSNPKSELSGVTLFKTGFADPIELQWGYELPLSGAKYKLWKQFGERLALKHSAMVRKELWY